MASYNYWATKAGQERLANSRKKKSYAKRYTPRSKSYGNEMADIKECFDGAYSDSEAVAFGINR